MSESSPIVDSPDDVTAYNPPSITPLQIQQKYYDSLMDCDWVKYDPSNNNSLVQNIAFALFGTPSEAGELVANANGSPNANGRPEEVNLQGYTSRQKEQVMRIYRKLREQGKYSLNDQDILMSVILVVCCRPNPLGLLELEPSDYWWNIHNRSDVNIWCTAVFRVRKCIPAFDGARGCRIYVDSDARVYQTWESYLKNNTQPKCVLVVPENGEYRGTLLEPEQRMALKVSVVPSPALGPKARIVGAADTTSTLASLGAITVLSAAVFTPVAPVVLAGAAATTVATGLYGLIRSGFHLRDRSAHEQAISPTNAEARGSWINIAASTVSVSGGAANNLLSRSAAAGTNMTKTGLILEASVDVLRHANMVTGGIGVVNSLALSAMRYQKHGEAPSSLELFQLTASTLFFANAVMSNRTAKSIIEEAQNKTIDQYRETLRSTKDRENFDKKREATRQAEGDIAGDTEIIRCIRNISDKDQYFHDVLRTNRDAKAQTIRVAFTPDGHLDFESEQSLILANNDNVIAETPTDVNTELILNLDLDGMPAEASTELLVDQSSNPTNLDSEGYSNLQAEQNVNPTNLDSLPSEDHSSLQVEHSVNPTNLDSLPAQDNSRLQIEHSVNPTNLDSLPAEDHSSLQVKHSVNPTNLDSLPAQDDSRLQIEHSVNPTNLDSLPAEDHSSLQVEHIVNPTNIDNLPTEPQSNYCSALDPADTATPDVYTELTPSVAVDTSAGNESEKPTQQFDPVSSKAKALAVLNVTSGAANASALFQPSSTIVSTSTSIGGRAGRSQRDNRSLINISPNEIMRIGGMLLRLTSFGAESVADLLHELSKDLHSALLTVSLNVLAAIVPEQLAMLRVLSPEKDIIVQVVEFVFNYMKHQRPFGEPCTSTDSGIAIILKDFFQDGHVRRESILYLTRQLEDYINERMNERRRQYPNKREITCESCSGIRYA